MTQTAHCWTDADVLRVGDICAFSHDAKLAKDVLTRGSFETERHQTPNDLRPANEIYAILTDVSEWQVCDLRFGLVDSNDFLLAGRYNLLE